MNGRARFGDNDSSTNHDGRAGTLDRRKAGSQERPAVPRDMTGTIRHRLGRLIDAGAFQSNGAGPLIVSPLHEDECALVLQLATECGWTVHCRGRGTWEHDDVPADIVLTTQRLNQVTEIKPADLFASVQAGVTVSRLQDELGKSNNWIPLDPPGLDRSIGSVAATGTAGGLRTRFGPVRDQILGMTIITATGKKLIAGGRVVKNVAGFDLPKLAIGGFGGFGLVTSLHLRIRVAPASNALLITTGSRTELREARMKIVASHVPMSAVEMRPITLNNYDQWCLSVRVTGSTEAVTRHCEVVRNASGVEWEHLDEERAKRHLTTGRSVWTNFPVSIRMGPQAGQFDQTLELLVRMNDRGFVTVYGSPPLVRWGGETTAQTLIDLREQLAAIDVPLTVERAPWTVLSSVAHFGSFRPGNRSLISSLRLGFDPARTLATAITVPG